jgi:hypothetical protein
MFHVKHFVNLDDILQGRILIRGKKDEGKCLRKKDEEFAEIGAKSEGSCLK